MTEENTTQENAINTEIKKYKFLAAGVVTALIISIISLVLSLLNITGVVGQNAEQGMHKKVVISKQYDKGKSLEKALNTKKDVVVFFYTDWCGFCQRFAPTYNKVSKNAKVKSKYAVAYVNCEKPENAKLMEEYKIEHFPTVYVITKTGNKVFVDNSLLFTEDAKTILADKLLQIADKNE